MSQTEVEPATNVYGPPGCGEPTTKLLVLPLRILTYVLARNCNRTISEKNL